LWWSAQASPQNSRPSRRVAVATGTTQTQSAQAHFTIVTSEAIA
jgi:hypothetical protein